MPALLSDMFLFWFRSVCKLLVSYGAPNTFKVHFQHAILCTLQYNSKTTGHLQPYYTPNNSFITEEVPSHSESSKPVTTYGAVYMFWTNLQLPNCSKAVWTIQTILRPPRLYTRAIYVVVLIFCICDNEQGCHRSSTTTIKNASKQCNNKQGCH